MRPSAPPQRPQNAASPAFRKSHAGQLTLIAHPSRPDDPTTAARAPPSASKLRVRGVGLHQSYTDRVSTEATSQRIRTTARTRRAAYPSSHRQESIPLADTFAVGRTWHCANQLLVCTEPI